MFFRFATTKRANTSLVIATTSLACGSRLVDPWLNGSRGQTVFPGGDFMNTLNFASKILVAGICFFAEARMSATEWGKAIVPESDCDVSIIERQLTITVPAGIRTLLSLRKVANVPRVVRPVSGDFDVRVKVTANWDADPLVDPPVPFEQEDGHWFVSGGLLVMADEQHYVRHSRNRTFNGKHTTTVPPVYDHGDNRLLKPRQFHDGRPFEGNSTWLKLRRQGQQITTWISHTGNRWFQTNSFETTLPERVQVGTYVANASGSEFSVVFEEFEIRTGETLDQTH